MAQSIAKLQDFNSWLGETPFASRIFIGGNHDFALEALTRTEVQEIVQQATYLEHSSTNIHGFHFFGSPLSRGVSRNQAFQKQSDEVVVAALREQLLPVDILVTHAPPEMKSLAKRGISGGSFADVVRRAAPEAVSHVLKAPLVRCWGHLHESHGKLAHLNNGGISVGCASLDGKFRTLHVPIVIDVQARE